MPHSPDFDEFSRWTQSHSVVPVYRQLLSDCLTPVSAFARLDAGAWSFLFESVVGGEKVGRYSFLGTKPFLTFVAKGRQITITTGDETSTVDSDDPMGELSKLIDRYKAPHLAGLPRFSGGAVGFAGYDAVRYTENLPNAPPDDRDIPDLCFGFYDQMVIFDHISKLVCVVAIARIDQADPRNAYDDACRRIDRLVDQLQSSSDQLTMADIRRRGDVSLSYQSNFTQPEFEQAVEKCKEYIRAGDFFQIVISQRLVAETQARPFDVYRTLRVVNPSPFMVLFEAPCASLVASSPEIMVRVENGEITVRPLAGTRPRGATEDTDQALADELLADPKERAEHIMLVDLGRNDVGRVSEFDSIRLSDLMTVERYSHVMHITSNVTGRLRDGLSPLDALRACLPAGTVSGAPKVRAMEVIDEIEPVRRGPYAGAIGYVDFTGNMDTCIALRTIVMQGNKAYVQAGAGIVYDSQPATEYQETLNKAKGMLKAIELTQQRLSSADS